MKTKFRVSRRISSTGEFLWVVQQWSLGRPMWDDMQTHKSRRLARNMVRELKAAQSRSAAA